MIIVFFLDCLFLVPACGFDMGSIGELSWNTRINGTYQTHNGFSLWECITKCYNNQGCCSINYNRLLQLCEINYVTKKDGIMYKNSDIKDFVQIDKDTWTPSVACKKDWCGSNEECTPTGCTVSDCGKAPAGPRNSYLVQQGHHVLGNGVVFACVNGFRLYRGSDVIAEKSFVVKCLSNGIWETHGYECKEKLNPIDCQDVKRLMSSTSGVYAIKPKTSRTEYEVYCDMDTDGIAWTVFQRRINGTVDFFRKWEPYKDGFGDISGEHWLGNDKIHQISSQDQYMLRVDLEDFSGNIAYSIYRTFTVGNEIQKYVLTAANYSGTAVMTCPVGLYLNGEDVQAQEEGDSLTTRHSGSKFSTKNADNDVDPRKSCALSYKGGWWYQSCHDANLNGLYFPSPRISSEGMIWGTWRKSENVKSDSMKMARVAYECEGAESCDDIKQCNKSSGVYRITIHNERPIDVYCDMDEKNNAWTVFQRRQDGSVDFYRGWNDYKEGFGNVHGEFWLGNDALHLLSSKTNYLLRVELADFCGETRFAEYSTFRLGDEASKYTLTATGYKGTAGDSLGYHNGLNFTTKDQDNNDEAKQCAIAYTGAWWYRSCHTSNLNGQYLGQRKDIKAKGIVWNTWRGYYNSFKYSTMKMRTTTP